jgi:hypothetical protein
LGETKQYKSNKIWGEYQPNKVPILSETSIVFKIIKHVTYLNINAVLVTRPNSIKLYYGPIRRLYVSNRDGIPFNRHVKPILKIKWARGNKIA